MLSWEYLHEKWPSNFSKGFLGAPSSLQNDLPSAILLNARSLFPKFDEFCLLVSTIRPDFVFITESWLHAGIKDGRISLLGYTLYRCDRKARVGGDVCIYISNFFGCTPDFSCGRPGTFESVSMRIPLLNLFVVCAHVPPNLKFDESEEIWVFYWNCWCLSFLFSWFQFNEYWRF